MKDPLFKQLTKSVVILVVLIVCLCTTSFALVLQVVQTNGNLFSTGRIEINLNDNQPVITDQSCQFEPGSTVVRDFFVENKGTWACYYKLYFSNVQGSLADTLKVTIKEGDVILYSGKMDELTRDKTKMTEKELAVGEKRKLTIQFYYPQSDGNITQGSYVTFDLMVDAVQQKNNPNKLFA